jgi:hypothetical protein
MLHWSAGALSKTTLVHIPRFRGNFSRRPASYVEQADTGDSHDNAGKKDEGRETLSEVQHNGGLDAPVPISGFCPIGVCLRHLWRIIGRERQ